MRQTVPFIALLLAGCGMGEARRIEVAKSQVHSLADRLEGQVTALGSFARPGEGSEFEFKEAIDPWEHPLKAAYTHGGFQEVVTVRSAGPDGLYANSDDIAVSRSKTTLAGVGSGIKQNLGTVVEQGARGLAGGLIQGVKDQLPAREGRKPRDGRSPEDR